MSAECSHAVFLSYASQDADAAHRIAETLRSAGLEVWCDQSELVGGDAPIVFTARYKAAKQLPVTMFVPDLSLVVLTIDGDAGEWSLAVR